MTTGLVFVGGVAVVLMTGVTIVDVVGRTVFGASLVGTYDIVQFALVITVYAGMAEAFRQGAHIAVDLIDRAGGERLGRALSIAALVCSLVVFLLLEVLSLREAFDAYRFADTTADLGVPKLWHWIGIVLGLTATCLTLAALLADTLRGGRNASAATRPHPDGIEGRANS